MRAKMKVAHDGCQIFDQLIVGYLFYIESNIHSCYYTFNGTERSEITKIGGGQAHETQESGTNGSDKRFL